MSLGRHGGDAENAYETRRSPIQVARLRVVEGNLVGDRDEEFDPELTPPSA